MLMIVLLLATIPLSGFGMRPAVLVVLVPNWICHVKDGVSRTWNAPHSGVMGSLTFAALLVSSTASLAKEPYPGIFGKDDRTVIEQLIPPWHAVGQVNIAGYRRRRQCTGTLIAPKLVITAAHCIIDNRTKKQPPPDRVHFVAGVKRDDHLGHARAKCVELSTAHPIEEKNIRQRLVSDVAFIVLDRPLSIPPAPVVPRPLAKPNLALNHASYPRDRRHMLSAHNDCRLIGYDGELWFTNCDTNHGSSGGPVFIRTNGEMSLAAVMVAVVPGKFSVAVPSGAWLPQANHAKCD